MRITVRKILRITIRKSRLERLHTVRKYENACI